MFEGIKNAFNYLFDLLGSLFEWTIEAIQAILQPVIDLFLGIGYFIYKLGVVFIEIVSVLGSVARLVFGLLQGLFQTITSFDYDGTSVNLPGSIGSAFTNLQPLFQTLQFNKIGFVVMFSIWLFTALAAVKIIQGFGGGNNA